MDKILILGSSGFIGKYLSEKLESIPITRKEADLLNFNSVKTLVEKHKPDIIINCVSNSDVSLEKFNNNAYVENIVIFNNLYHLRQKVDKIICFGSGAEFDRTQSIDLAKEKDIFIKNPKDHYGLSKNIIAKLIQNTNDNLYNLRLFGCFHHRENETRLLKKLTKQKLIISNRYFDYFWLEDLLKVVEFYIKNDNLPKDVNLVYKEKMTLEKFISLFSTIKKINPEYAVSNCSLNYTGCSETLYSLGLNLQGIEVGLEKYEI